MPLTALPIKPTFPHSSWRFKQSSQAGALLSIRAGHRRWQHCPHWGGMFTKQAMRWGAAQPTWTRPAAQGQGSWPDLGEHVILQSWEQQDLPPLEPNCLHFRLRITYTVGQGRLPVLVFFSGFGAYASWYQGIVDRVASSGYAVVQYDAMCSQVGPLLNYAVNIEKEVATFPSLLGWLDKLNSGERSGEFPGAAALQGLMDLSKVVVGGHSRGGKIATLVFLQDMEEGGPGNLRAAYLLDPIDLLCPAAVAKLQALKSKGHAVDLGITGAGNRNSLFNPSCVNFEKFKAAASDTGSAVRVLEGVGHLDFCDAGPARNRLLDCFDACHYPELPKRLLAGVLGARASTILLEGLWLVMLQLLLPTALLFVWAAAPVRGGARRLWQALEGADRALLELSGFPPLYGGSLWAVEGSTPSLHGGEAEDARRVWVAQDAAYCMLEWFAVQARHSVSEAP